MTGYTHGTIAAGEKESVGVITDFVDPGLTEFIKKVIEEVSFSFSVLLYITHPFDPNSEC